MKEIKLSDGRVAKIREGKGKDLFWAMEMANSPAEITKLLCVRLVEIEGRQITEDELEDLPIADAMAILTEVGKFLSQTQKQS